MKIGLLIPFTGKNAHPAEFARVAESLGFESIWVPEHPAMPANPTQQFPDRRARYRRSTSRWPIR